MRKITFVILGVMALAFVGTSPVFASGSGKNLRANTYNCKSGKAVKNATYCKENGGNK